MRSFGTAAVLKKNNRSARSDQKGCRDYREYEGTDRDALRDDLQDASAPFGQF